MTQDPSQLNDKNDSVNLAALTVEQMAEILGKAGGFAITAEDVKSDIERGAPADSEGRMNLLAYAAWLAKDTNDRGQ